MSSPPDPVGVEELCKLLEKDSWPASMTEADIADVQMMAHQEAITRLRSLAAENARLVEGGFTAKDGATWVRKDSRDEARAQRDAALVKLLRLREAAEPFSREISPDHDDGEPYRAYFSVGDLRRLAQALKGEACPK